MGELGFRSLHKEKKTEKESPPGGRGEGAGGEGDREPTAPQPLSFQKQWAVREQWLQTKSWAIFICHSESQTGGTGILPWTYSSNWIWPGRKMRSPGTPPA